MGKVVCADFLENRGSNVGYCVCEIEGSAAHEQNILVIRRPEGTKLLEAPQWSSMLGPKKLGSAPNTG